MTTQGDRPLPGHVQALSDPCLPAEGYVELDIDVEEMWRIFNDVRRWPEWNPSFWVARVGGGELALGATL